MRRHFSRFPERVLATIRQYGMLSGGERVLVAVSGGPDSVALLAALEELGEELRLVLEVAHVHHGLRAEAEADAEFTRAVAERLGVPFHLERVAVRSGPPWDGLEAEARRARYAALEACASAVDAQRIATGHTADDQAETVLMRLLEGAGPRGLAGIAPVRGRVIRPLLDARRSDVTAYVAERGLSAVEDASNRDRRFARNRIRHDVLPELGRVCGGDVVGALCRSAALTRARVTEHEALARAELARLGTPGPCGIVFAVADLAALSREVAADVLLAAAAAQDHARPQRGAVHRALRRLLADPPARRPLRAGRLAVERSGRWLRVGPARPAALVTRAWRVPGALELTELGLALEARCFARPSGYAPPRDPRCVAFDADLLPTELVVRARRRGERVSAFGAQGERRLKSLLGDAGVPRWERPRVPILEAAGDVAWVAGVRRGAVAPVRDDTNCILEVTLRPL